MQPSRSWKQLAVSVPECKNSVSVLYKNTIYFLALDTSPIKVYESVIQNTLSKFDLIKTKSPPNARSGVTCTVYQDELYMIGGINKGGIWTLNFLTWEWKSLKEFEFISRTGHSAVLYKDSIIIYGGYPESYEYNDTLYQFSISQRQYSWMYSTSKRKPRPRVFAAASVYADDLYIFGGESALGVLNDCWVFHFPNKEWKEISIQPETPCPRLSATLVCHNDSMYLFGGRDFQWYCDDLVEFKISSKEWSKVPLSSKSEKPVNRAFHSAIVYEHTMYIIGGKGVESKYVFAYQLQDMYLSRLTTSLEKNVYTDVIIHFIQTKH